MPICANNQFFQHKNQKFIKLLSLNSLNLLNSQNKLKKIQKHKKFKIEMIRKKKLFFCKNWPDCNISLYNLWWVAKFNLNIFVDQFWNYHYRFLWVCIILNLKQCCRWAQPQSDLQFHCFWISGKILLASKAPFDEEP